MNLFERAPQFQSEESQPTPELLPAELRQELTAEEAVLYDKLQENPDLARRFVDYVAAETTYQAPEPHAGLVGEAGEVEQQRLSTLRQELVVELGTTDGAINGLMQRIETYQDSQRGNSQSAAA